MVNYDQAGVTYDAIWYYDDGGPTQSKPKKRMASLKLNLSKQNPAQLIALADIVIPKLAPTAPATPPIPNMATKVTALGVKKAAAKLANDQYEAALAALPALKQARDATADLLRTEHASVGAAVESECKGDPVMLATSGYPLAGDNTPASTPPGQVLNMSVTAGDADGSVDVQFDPQDNVTYEVQITTGDPITGPYTTMAHPTASHVNIPGLTSGTRIWARARALGSKGPGPWSDPASKIVP